MKVFGAPYSFFFPGGHAGGSGNHAAQRQNLLMFGTEMGGSGTVTPECLKICEEGVRRFLSEIGVLKTVELNLQKKKPGCFMLQISTSSAMPMGRDCSNRLPGSEAKLEKETLQDMFTHRKHQGQVL